MKLLVVIALLLIPIGVVVWALLAVASQGPESVDDTDHWD